MSLLQLTPAFHFSVDFFEPVPTLLSAVKFTPLGQFISADMRFQQVSGLSYKMDKSEFREGGQLGNPHTLFNKVDFPELVLKRGILISHSQVSSWFDTAMETLTCHPLQVLVSLLNEKGLPNRAWLVDTAFPTAWELGELNAEQNTMAIETLTLSYESFRTISL